MAIFSLRPYSKKSLALLYFPDSSPHTAVNHLMSWIKKSPGLSAQLNHLGYQKTAKWFSPKQVEAIIDFLGTPFGFE